MPIWLPPSFKGVGLLKKKPQPPEQPDSKYRPTIQQRLRAGAGTIKRRLEGVRPNREGLRDISLDWPVYRGPIPVYPLPRQRPYRRSI